MERHFSRILTFLAFFSFQYSWGHIDKLKLNGISVATANSSQASDQVFIPGQTVSVTWDVTIAHTEATTYISYSNNGGAWVEVITFPGNTNNLGSKSYSWTIPELNSNKVKIRVYQAHSPKSNPANTSSDDYNLVSGAFTIKPISMAMQAASRPKSNGAPNNKDFTVNGAQIAEQKQNSVTIHGLFRKFQ